MTSTAEASLDDVLDAFQSAPSQSEKGTKFEQLMVRYFQQDPTLAKQYDHVTRWTEWPHRDNQPDTGIDLVARNREDQTWTAIQCKFYNQDHYLAKADIDSFFTASGKTYNGVGFTNRIIISTTDHWSKHAEDALANQAIPVQRIGTAEIAASPIDWSFATPGKLDVELNLKSQFHTHPHQDEAIAKILHGFETHDRGQWISACGTGKTFTSLKLAEQLAAANNGSLRVLFLAPSIQLVSQTLREWTAQARLDLRPFVVCSDTKASRVAEDLSVHDVVLPATTDATELFRRLQHGRRATGLSVVFSTYQSIDVVAAAQQLGAGEFDLILCDEAHRTTGVTLAGEDASSFVKVHNNSFIKAAKRLYMTATPRMFGDDTKGAAEAHSAELSSMDDVAVFGPVFHRLGFGEAVDRDLLTDYKVMVLMVSEDQMAGPLQSYIANQDHEIPLDDAAKIIGCWNGLAKRTKGPDGFPADAVPMKRAVAFLQDIRSSKRVAQAFPELVEEAEGVDSRQTLLLAADHVDGTMNALERSDKLNWLKAPVPDGECRILTNARCLSEGVDVPALDAVLFMSPRSSQVDVVQSVGRVMRKAPGKDYGYIILPVAVPAGVEPDKALNDNTRFKVVWEVLNALRAHDDRFDAMVNSIKLNKGTDNRIIVDAIPGDHGTGDDDTNGLAAAMQPALFSLGEWKDSLYGKIVAKVGTKEYWDRWAADVAEMSAAQIARINALLQASDDTTRDTFNNFLHGLRANLNDSISAEDAVSMLSQHLITAPVFDALFGESSFAAQNPVSVSMQAMLDLLEGQGLQTETEKLDKFYRSVRVRAESVTSAEGRQDVIHDLYEKFFRNAFPKQAQSLGVVYTPVEVVDFILRAADDLSRQEFGQGLSDEGVHILDPFTGTGTFIVRLLQTGIINPHDLARKYTSELWANEIMLLAYYIACVNIETTYHALTGAAAEDYTPFPGATMTDTFQIHENGDRADTSLIPANNERIEAQLATDIRVIIGNPPYSVGQDSANDNNANLTYPTLDERIADTYAKRTTATNKNSLYDSYIRAFRWATDRIGDQGIVAFVSNGGWVDGNTAAGMRLSLADEYSSLYVYNLRGNARTAGELRRKEKDNVFGQGARTTVAIFIGIKNPIRTGPCTIHYRDIGDYLSREDKLHIVNTAQLDSIPWQTITPNDHGDWLNQRNDSYLSYPPIGLDKNETGVAYFTSHSRGVETTRDAWCYNYSATKVETNMRNMIDFYNEQASRGVEKESDLDTDPTQISWSRNIKRRALKRQPVQYDPDGLREASYRPFARQSLYFDRVMNSVPGQGEVYFPTPHHANVGIYQVGNGSAVPFTVLATDSLPDLHLTGAGSGGQYFPRWTYEKGPSHADQDLFGTAGGEGLDEHGYRRVDNITDEIQALYTKTLREPVRKDDIFTYVYGVLHSPDYRAQFTADLRKMLPRIPLPESLGTFRAFADAGRELMDLHIGYEDVDPYPLEEGVATRNGIDDYELYRLEKLKFVSKTDKSTLIYNRYITLTGIPEEAHQCMLGSRSALEWIIDRYQVKTDKVSGIVNDPNDWSQEHGEPRYIIDLIKKVVTVSVRTVEIVDGLRLLPL
ncbi:DEAD/DEAH box helicase [Propionibacteriaceae bacterium G1746]